MNYKETLDWMFSKLPMYQRQGKTAFKKDLTNIIALADHLNNPQNKFKSVHVAGTNGKGSTSHMIASILQEAGYKVGLYTSPHLKDFRERIKVNGNMIGKTEVIYFIDKNQSFIEKQQLSFFEMTVGLAFEYFASQKVDIAIIEVGLGGRLDSTNIIMPEVSVITNIGYDHMQMLGETLAEIAYEKAGIIKNGIPVVISEKQLAISEVFEKIAKDKNAQMSYAEDEVKESYKTDLLGNYQNMNIKAAVQAIKILNKKGYKVLSKHIKTGLLNVVNNTGLIGRWQVIQNAPKIICDTAHNKEGLNYVIAQLTTLSYDKLHIILGVVNDKDLDTILPLFPKNAVYYFCRPDIPRGLDADLLQSKAKTYGLYGSNFQKVSEALKIAKKEASKNDIIFVGG
ncbi:MAG: bifunctional folylpolyglutamate synthase/dihydrofolate synthase, partial [Flavobacteriaceae bacterium]|nr:bifunctional folylpolyglutamate synthase/dihydrofolate synthase [Flavobacteriaceae bacterium]